MSTGSNEQMITGGELVAKALKAEGVEVIYTLCGGHIIDIYNGCLNEGIKIIDVRHEEVASHAADGYARMTGKPGCAVVTAGPGTTHALTGVANAFRAEIPMLLIGGQSSLTQPTRGRGFVHAGCVHTSSAQSAWTSPASTPAGCRLQFVEAGA